MDTTVSLGLWIRRRRKALDLTQEGLAQRVSCAVITLRKIESGAHRPSRQIAERLANEFHLTPEERKSFLQAVHADLRIDRLGPLSVPHPTLPKHALDPQQTLQPDLPRGILTFLMSEALLEWPYPEPSSVLPLGLTSRVTEVLATTIAARQGLIVKRDGCCWWAVFADASAAVQAALAAQELLQRPDAGSIHSIQVRMALHTGPTMLIENEYAGPTALRASSLLAAAHGGQILTSQATYELVRTQLPSTIVVHDLGCHRLSDLTDPEHLFQLSTPALRCDFPPQRTLQVQRHNLPTLTTPLLGRKHDVHAVCSLLQQPDVHLLSLTGAGGTGKTRLALQVAAELLPSFADGVVFVDLSPLRDADMVLPTIGEALGVLGLSSSSLLHTVIAALRAQDLLLVLDNFEHLLAAAPLLDILMTEAPNLKLLVTSRAVLHIPGEYEYNVIPLPPPKPTIPWTAAAVEQSAAVALFVQCVQAVQPQFVLTDQNAQTIAEICIQLDGLPLAIELAAARCQSWSPQDLLAELSERMRVLVNGPNGLPVRQQSLYATIDWSYQLLSPTQQRLFRLLGVFAGGATLDCIKLLCRTAAVSAMQSERDTNALVESLNILVDHNLLRYLEDTDGEPRFLLLETIREYALEQLKQADEYERFQALHARIYQELVEQTTDDTLGHQQSIRFAQLEREYHNICAALHWSLRTGNSLLAVRLCQAMRHFWLLRCYLNDGCHWIAQALTAAGATTGTADRRDQVILGVALADMLDMLGDWQAAEHRLRTVREQMLQLGDPVLAAHVSRVTGSILYKRGDYEEALQVLEQARQTFTVQGRHHDLVQTLRTLSTVHFEQGNYAEVLAVNQACLQLASKIGDDAGSCKALNELGIVAGEQGHYRQAIAYFEQGLAIAEERQFHKERTLLMANLGTAYLESGEYMGAYALYQRGLHLALPLGLHDDVMLMLANLGTIYYQIGQYVHAQQCYHAVLSDMQVLDPRHLGWMLYSLAKVTVQLGDAGLAQQLFGQAIVICRTFAIRYWLVHALYDQASHDLQRQEFANAQIRNDEALALATQLRIRTIQLRSTILGIRLQVLLNRLDQPTALTRLNQLCHEWTEPDQQALLDYTCWQIDPAQLAARYTAAMRYRALYTKTPNVEHRKCYHELTGEWLPDLPHLPDPPPIVYQHPLDLPDFLARVDALLAAQPPSNTVD